MSKANTSNNSKKRAQRSKDDRGEEKVYPRSYRLDTELKTTLESTLRRVNALAPKKVSEARLIKALILLSKDLETEKIVKAVKEIW